MYWDYEGGTEWGMAGTADVWFRLHGLSGTFAHSPVPMVSEEAMANELVQATPRRTKKAGNGMATTAGRSSFIMCKRARRSS